MPDVDEGLGIANIYKFYTVTYVFIFSMLLIVLSDWAEWLKHAIIVV